MSSFGEIVEPITRTAWEDWDEIIPEQNETPKLKWTKDVDTPNEIVIFFICEGKYLCHCVKTQTHNINIVNSIPEVNLLLYKTEDKYICTINDYNLVQSSEIVELLKPYLAVSTDVIAIQTKALPEYYATAMSTRECIIRTISTTNPSTLGVNFPKLEQPNIISGVSAGVVCLREHLEQCATAVVCYIEHPEEYQIEEVQRLLQKLHILHDVKSRQNTVLNSNLYI